MSISSPSGTPEVASQLHDGAHASHSSSTAINIALSSLQLWTCVFLTALFASLSRGIFSRFLSRDLLRKIERLLEAIDEALPDRIHLEILPMSYFILGGLGPMLALGVSYYALGAIYHFGLDRVYHIPWNKVTRYPTYALAAAILLQKIVVVVGVKALVAAAGMYALSRMPSKDRYTRGSLPKFVQFPLRLLFGFSTYFALACDLCFDTLLYPTETDDRAKRRGRKEKFGRESRKQSRASESASGKASMKGNLKPFPVPKGASDTVKRILEATTHYEVREHRLPYGDVCILWPWLLLNSESIIVKAIFLFEVPFDDIYTWKYVAQALNFLFFFIYVPMFRMCSHSLYASFWRTSSRAGIEHQGRCRGRRCPTSQESSIPADSPRQDWAKSWQCRSISEGIRSSRNTNR